MRRFFALLLIAILSLTGCTMEDGTSSNVTSSTVLSDQYNVGDEITLGSIHFNIYKIDDNNNELFLLAQRNIANTTFSDPDRSYKNLHDYEGSLVEKYVQKFVHDLEDEGYTIKASGIIEKDDLLDLGFEVAGLNGTKYDTTSAPDFLENSEPFWVDGYCKYNTYAWVYRNGTLTTYECEDEYGVRPIVVVDSSEVGKQPFVIDPSLSIESIVSSGSAWISEGGIHNPYDRFYFDCENMIFINEFESPELKDTFQYNMEFIDEQTIMVYGFGRWYPIPATLTIVDENKLRLRFVDDTYNDGDYFLIKEVG